MINNLLPIGTVIEKDNKKYIIVSYNKRKDKEPVYSCVGYPIYYIIDLIPISKRKEFENKYKFYDEDRDLAIDEEYKVIHEGYKDERFYEFKENFIKNIDK